MDIPEYIIEALAPTTEMDFDQLEEKRSYTACSSPSY
jgi:hypothetical protein